MLAGAVKEEIITAPSASLDLLIACTEGVPCVPLASMLMTFGDIHSVTSYDTSVGTPTLEQLLNYDVVLTYSNGYYLDSVQMGNVLADYCRCRREGDRPDVGHGFGILAWMGVLWTRTTRP